MLIYPNAKINIGLNVVEKRPDGYHNLETVFYPVNLLDALEITADDADGEDCALKLSGEILGGRPEDNLVVKAFKALQHLYPNKVKPVAFHLHKHIPTGAGLGGGSADAAFTIKALNERFMLGLNNEEMERVASKIGADCPFFIQNKPVFATGIGDVFTPVSLSLKGKYIVLVKPDAGISTYEAYAQIVPTQPNISLNNLVKKPIESWKDMIVNDFEKSVFAKYPEIAAIKDRLYDLGAIYASMSGSGTAVYGIFNQPIEGIDVIFTGYFCRQRECMV